MFSGIVTDCVIDSYFFEDHLNGPMYANFSRDVFLQLLEDVPLNVRVDMWMQHNGAPPHNAMYSTLVMNYMFPRWIGQEGTIN